MLDSTKKGVPKGILMRSVAPIHLRHPKDERWLHKERYVHMHACVPWSLVCAACGPVVEVAVLRRQRARFCEFRFRGPCTSTGFALSHVYTDSSVQTDCRPPWVPAGLPPDDATKATCGPRSVALSWALSAERCRKPRPAPPQPNVQDAARAHRTGARSSTHGRAALTPRR